MMLGSTLRCCIKANDLSTDSVKLCGGRELRENETKVGEKISPVIMFYD
jgi:hypothetical protein